MPSIKAYVIAAKEFLDAAEPRLALKDADALALAREVDVSACRHPERLVAAISLADSIPPLPDPENEADLLAYAEAVKIARERFWDAFEGEVVEGVQITRRTA